MHRLLLIAIACAALAAGDPAPAPVSYAPMIERVAPAVVTVHSAKEVRRPQGPGLPDAFRFFFGQPDDERAPPGLRPRQPRAMPPRLVQGQGSGVIVRADGLILTNNHVIDQADELHVTIPGIPGPVPAKLVGTDPRSDLALIRIDPAGRTLATIEFADSAKARVGDLVFAIGNPFGVGQTVTMGIISATGRGDVGIVDYEDFIQTDASINPGNSGGALVDSLGRLVGVNTAILSPSGGNLGIGFAVPANLARQVMDQIADAGKVVRGFLGVQIGPVQPALARKFKVPADAGALVQDVVEDSPAAKAGIRPGDVIVRLDGQAVPDPRQLRMRVAMLKPGSAVKLGIFRDGAEQEVAVRIGELPADDGGATAAERGGRIGISLADLSPEVRKRLSIPDRVAGALIDAVRPGSRAERAGLAAGMVIIEVERQPVADAEAAARAMRQIDGDLLLRVWTDGGVRWIVVPAGE